MTTLNSKKESRVLPFLAALFLPFFGGFDFVFKESLTAMQLFGGALIIASVIAITLEKSE